MRMRAWTGLLTFGLAVALVAGAAMAQPPGGQRGPGGRMGFGMGPGMGGGVLGLLRVEKVQKELELTDDQKAELEKVAEQARERMRSAFQGGGQGGGPERFRQLQEETNKAVQNVLLPHQWKRLNQIQLQVTGLAGSLMREDVRKELGVTEEQAEKIREATRQVFEQMRGERPQGERPDPAQMRERFQQMRQKAEEAVMSQLTEEQKKKWNEMIGEKFEIDMSELMPGPGAGPGGQGPGGRRGGGNRGA